MRAYSKSIPNIRKIIIVRKIDFKKVKTDPLSGVSALLDRIVRKLGEDDVQ